MRVAVALAVGVLSIGFGAAPKVGIRVHPHIVNDGGVLRISCLVQRDEKNRQLRMGLEAVERHVDESDNASWIQLEGESAPMQWVRWYRVTCESGSAFCETRDSTDAVLAHVAAAMVVAGC